MTGPRGDKHEDQKSSQTRMLFVTDSIQRLQQIPYQGRSLRVWRLHIRTVILTEKYADDIVVLAEEEMVLQGMIDRLIEIGRCCGKNLGDENLKATINSTDYGRSKTTWRMWNVSSVWVT